MKGSSFEANPGINKPSIVIYNCNPSYAGGGGKRIVDQGQPPAKSKRPSLNNMLKQKGWHVWFKL
jgi:hypothetical protein